MVQEVNSKKFDALISKAIMLKECPKCNSHGAELRVDFPWYGKTGAYCSCYRCGYETKRRPTNIVICDERRRIGTPTIEKSLMSAIRQAINDWNKGSEQ